MLTDDVKKIVKSTAPLLEKEGAAISQKFYSLLFEAHPELTQVFNMANQERGVQPQALANAVFAYAAHIDQLDELASLVDRTAHKHASLAVQPEQYPIVGKFLLRAIQQHFSLEDDHEILTSWAVAYQALADIFVGAEQDIYSKNQSRPGGWFGFREFLIANIVDETPLVKSFVLEPVDGAPIASPTPGQYVGVKIQLDDEQSCIRQYSLSHPGPRTSEQEQSYRITVKAETQFDEYPGLGSNQLHRCVVGDRLSLQPPTGVFALNPNDDKPAVFLAGGIGVTPLLAMALQLSIEAPSLLVNSTFIQACLNEQEQSMRAELEQLSHRYGMEYLVHYDQKADGTTTFISDEDIKSWLPGTGRPVYLCGPAAFMDAMKKALLAHGFAADNIRSETFGPHLG